MSYVERFGTHEADSSLDRLRANLGQRTTGIAVALAVEALLLYLLLTLGEVSQPHKEVPLALTSFDARERAEDSGKAKEKKPHEAPRHDRPHPPEQKLPPTTQPSPTPPEMEVPQQPAAIIPVSPQQMQGFDISRVPRQQGTEQPAGAVMGPTFTPVFGDSQRVGTAPNGQPMYAASWYREPTDRELRGYLSTAEGPGWGLITCKTVPDYRVEDCIGLDEYPEGSHIMRSVLAAAWQFRVRPPRVGGVTQVGDWVRIKIYYQMKMDNSYGDPTKPSG